MEAPCVAARLEKALWDGGPPLPRDVLACAVDPWAGATSPRRNLLPAPALGAATLPTGAAEAPHRPSVEAALLARLAAEEVFFVFALPYRLNGGRAKLAAASDRGAQARVGRGPPAAASEKLDLLAACC